MVSKRVARAWTIGLTLAAAALIAGPAARAGPLGGVATTPGARPSLPVEGVITNPDWAERPSGDDVSEYYPKLPQEIFLSGRAEVSCAVAATGILNSCGVIAETPVGFGFGGAALRLTSLFRMRPETLDGRPTSGGRVRIPINFAMEDTPAPAPQSGPAEPGPPPTPEALVLARRIQAASPIDARARDAVATFVDHWREGMGDAATREQRVALDVLQQAEAEADVRRKEHTVDRLARTLPIDSLRRIAAFLESPPGRAWAEASNAASMAEVSDADAIDQRIGAQARYRLCRQIACLPKDTPATPATQ